MVVPRLIRQALSGQPLTVYGDGNQSRCFCHVNDAVEALVTLLDEPACAGELFNVGSTEQVSIKDLAKKIISQTGSRSEIQYVPYEKAYGNGFEDMRHRVPSLEKIKKQIGFNPKHDLSTIIQTIVEHQSEES